MLKITLALNTIGFAILFFLIGIGLLLLVNDLIDNSGRIKGKDVALLLPFIILLIVCIILFGLNVANFRIIKEGQL